MKKVFTIETRDDDTILKITTEVICSQVLTAGEIDGLCEHLSSHLMRFLPLLRYSDFRIHKIRVKGLD